LDTVQANEELGFKPDLRNYGIGAQILVDLGVRKMRLLTNNPKKMVGLEGYGLEIVEQVPIQVEINDHNRCYLECKKLKMGHALNMDVDAAPNASKRGQTAYRLSGHMQGAVDRKESECRKSTKPI
jgi:3,4-dihydroxy 2-butanone 4-phosphate synthase/GTP cyclohydrolase II